MKEDMKSMVARSMTGQFLFHILVYTMLLIFAVFFGYLWAISRIWYPDDPWWYILNFIEDHIVIVFALVILAGCIMISCFYFYRMAKMLEQVLKAVDDMYLDKTDRIVLSPMLKEAEHQLNQIMESTNESKRRAKEAEQRKNDMIVYMAHDLKTPLTSVLGYLRILKDEKVDETMEKKYIETAFNKAKRLEHLIEDFFEVAKLNHSSGSLEWEEVNMSRMLEQILYEFKPMMGKKGMDYSYVFEPDLIVCCDIKKMERVFDNLIKNAISYGWENTKICVELKKSGSTGMEVRVENRGNTIPPEMLERIFEQFYRADAARDSKTGGTGLGLAIAKEIIELHGGSIHCESADEIIRFIMKL